MQWQDPLFFIRTQRVRVLMLARTSSKVLVFANSLHIGIGTLLTAAPLGIKVMLVPAQLGNWQFPVHL
jgi:hypothetical protein